MKPIVNCWTPGLRMERQMHEGLLRGVEALTLECSRTQHLARSVLAQMQNLIVPGMTERAIAEACESLLREEGATSFWYYDVGALVLVGDRTTLSLSGREYSPTGTVVRPVDLVTIDVSPAVGPFWGDCARSFIVGDAERSSELRRGAQIVERLHAMVLDYAAPSTTFGDIFRRVNGQLQSLGFENLDFRSNLGHTIERDIRQRRFIEADSQLTLEQAHLFTFEPHLRAVGGRFGFKFEEIYRLKDDKLQLL
jgi:Xaa-Pro aminopeptidase